MLLQRFPEVIEDYGKEIMLKFYESDLPGGK
jgi:hypothetical protein